MVEHSTTRRVTGLLCTAVTAGCMWGYAPAAALAASGSLHAARQSLLRYEASTEDGSTLSMLQELSVFGQGDSATDARDHAEARFLRAAAATDLLVLARVRDDAQLQPALETALGVPKGSAYTHLDAELAVYAQVPGYAEPAAQMRSALALARDPKPSQHLASYRGVSSSERDLLFLHAMSQLAVSEANPIAALAAYGETPKAGTPVADAFDAAGGRSVATLVEAGKALKRLNDAANDGDPLAASAAVERAIFAITIPDLVVPPAPNLKQDGLTWGRVSKTPDLVVWVSEQGIRYGFAPSAQLDTAGDIKLFARGEPSLPATAEVLVQNKSLPFIHPVTELSDWLHGVLAAQPDCSIAVVVEPNASAVALGNTLASFKRGGGSEVVLIGRDAQGKALAQNVQITFKNQADAEPTPAADLTVRVRLGGYTVKLPSGQELDIPRVKDESGWHFDTAGLAAQIGTRKFSSSQVSFMADVAYDQVSATLFQVASNSRTLSLLLQ